jgi:hypothetical protein
MRSYDDNGWHPDDDWGANDEGHPGPIIPDPRREREEREWDRWEERGY